MGVYGFLIATLAISGCGKSEQTSPNVENGDDPGAEYKDKKENQNDSEVFDISDFSIKVGDKYVSLEDGDYEVDLEGFFGKPQQEPEVYQLEHADTLTGLYMKKIKFDGIELEFFKPGKDFVILSMEISDSKYETARGIKVGDSLESLKKAYPELELLRTGDTGL
ncbi:MAG: hypothetical protein IBX56_19670 [Methylomicrobium sp.]|nr:hypothetical protein [Methylomicrobium sp.]